MTTMIKKRVAELEGAQLDWAVAVAQGWAIDAVRPGVWKNASGVSVRWSCSYSPSTKWDEAGPIIDRERIWLAAPMGVRTQWSAAVYEATDSARGPTPLIAAMRAFVASRLGDEVEVPV